MKILFLVRHPLYLRNYESVLRLLAERGHRVHLAFTPLHKAVEETLAAELTAGYPGITASDTPARRGWWWPAGDALRSFTDYLRYLDPRYAQAPALAARAARRIPWPLRKAFEVLAPLRSRLALRALRALAGLIERALPADPACLRLIRDQAPDLVLLTPMVDFLYSQSDYLKAARALGLPTALAVASWDNLSNKGLVQPLPDRLLVWNEIQKQEAAEMHGVPGERVVVTGAQLFDHWFAMQPRWSRAELCRRVGRLDAERPILLYLCSSSFVCPDEVAFVKRWIGLVRAAEDPRLSGANLLIRPHPAHLAQWRDVDLSGEARVAVWPDGSGVPIDEERKHGYFDSLYHADAVVGINTSGFIEAGIVGRRTLSLRTSEFRATQEGTLHFHYLTEGGLLTFAESDAEHLRQLSETLDDKDRLSERIRGFVERFVRPHGRDRAATPIFVEALEALPAGVAARPRSEPLWAPLLRALIWPLVAGAIRPHYLARLRMGTLPGAEGPGMARHCPPRGQTPRAAARKVRRVTRFTARRLEALAASDKPILVGPWLSEVGFELLYWIPFLSWATRAYGLEPERLIVVTRGGAACWYQRIGGRHVDLLTLYSPEEFRRLNLKRQSAEGLQKQKRPGAFDGEIVEKVRRHLGLPEVELLHPSLMYAGVLRYHWSGISAPDHLFMHARYHPLTPPEPGPIEAGLPQDYFAVRFYSRDSFEDSAKTRRFIAGIVDRLCETADVVVLDCPFELDEHRDTTRVNGSADGAARGAADGAARGAARGRHGNRVIRVGHLMQPADNLEVQTRIIARSRGFVGTYGGLSYIAPFYGRPAVSFHERPGDVLPSHVNTASTVFASFGVPFVVLTPADAALLESVL